MVLWIFGYGSLIWTPNFQYEERVCGFIKDFKRVFAAAGCADHRRPDNTGRAGLGLTLQPQEGAITAGVAYRVTADVEHQILSSCMEEALSSRVKTSRILMLDVFTGKEASDIAPSIRAMTYITPPGSTNLWHIVLQLDPELTTDNHRDRVLAGPHHRKIMTSKSAHQCFSARRPSTRDNWKCDRAWFESQYNRAAN